MAALPAFSISALAKNPGADPVPPPGPVSTSLPDGISLQVPSVIKAGAEIDADATLAIGGYLREGAGLHFIIDDVERRMVRTDASGTAHFRLRGVLTSGVHQLVVRYHGSKQYFFSEPASATTTFVVAPLIITVDTVPAMPGVTLTLDGGKGVVSDTTGVAILGVARAGIHTMTVSVPPPDQTSRISFVRWSDDSWRPSRSIRVVSDLSISVGLRAAYLTPIQFVGLDGNPLDPTRVSDVVISGPNAEVIQLQYPYDPIWLQTPLPAKHSGEGGLHITPAPYSLSFARYTNLNVASTGQMRYTPTLEGTWSIPLLLFILRMGARDAIFGTTLDNPIRLTGPTGRAQIVTLGQQGRITLVLSRGNYSAQVLAAGVTPVATIALSRSQEVIVPVITPIDLIVIGFAVLLTMVAVFVAGRGRLWAFGRIAAVHVRYGAPILGRWESRSPQARAFLSAAALMVERLRGWVLPVARTRFDGAEMVKASVGTRDSQSPRILDDGFTLGIPYNPELAVAVDAQQPPETSVALRAVSAFPRSYLLGDETGLTQITEAGLIIRGLLNAGKAKRVLLLVHSSTIGQWQRELNERFAIRIPRFDKNTFYDHEDRELAWSGNPWSAFPLMLASSHLARRRDRRDELLAGGPWDVVVVDVAHEAHRSGRKPMGTPNKLLALLHAMKSSHSWTAVYLASGASTQLRLHEALEFMDLLGLTRMPAEVATDFTRYFSIPLAKRPSGDWEFVRQMCADHLSDMDPAPAREPKRAAGRMSRARRSRPYRGDVVASNLSSVTAEPAESVRR